MSVSSREFTGPTSNRTVQQAKDTVQAKMGEARQYLHRGTETLRDEAVGMRGLTDRARARVSAPMGRRIDGLMEMVRHRPVVPAAVVVLGVLMVLRRLLRRNK